ncbi:hypothetical protein D1AOALGA4SA_98 [Olavius algarvensis Delta 1 endosymbiont]|nr:hypothetical protein D1AOALGA4SA_98 [Olavius algarvensis Delta 1 endosymbiont]
MILIQFFYFVAENLVLPPGCRPYSPTRRARVYEPEAGPEAGPGQSPSAMP